MRRTKSRLRELSLFAVAAAAAGCSASNTHYALDDSGRDLVLRNVTIVDTRDGHLSAGMTVSVKAGKIASIDKGLVNLAGSVPTVDAQGKFLVPGFVDAHVHVLDSNDAENEEALMLANGITGMRQMSGSVELLEKRREGRLFQSTFAPKLLAMPGRVLVTTNAFSPKEGVREVDRQKAQGADFIKVALVPPRTFYAVGAEAKKLGLPFEGHVPPGVDAVEAVNAGYRSIEHLGPGGAILVDCSTEEDALKRETAAHPLRRPPPVPEFLVEMFIHKLTLDPLLAEIFFDSDTIPRMQRMADTFDESKCRKVAAAIARSGSWQVPTLIRIRTSEFADDPEYGSGANWKYVPAAARKSWMGVSRDFSRKITPAGKATILQFWELQRKLARMLDEAGVPMLTGTDSATETVAGYNLHQEFALLAEDGFTPLEILQMATRNAARFYGREASMGSVEVGRDADLVLLDGNPVERVRNLDGISAVVRNGVFYSREALDAKLRGIAERVRAGR